MSNASFTRDEVILALDVLYFSGAEHLTKNSPEIIELCQLLQELPIHPKEGRPESFRNEVGVSDQIRRFQNEREGRRYNTWHVGTTFHAVRDEYDGNLEEIHSIAQAIKRNKSYFIKNLACMASFYEFREGALLTNLHLSLERKESMKNPVGERCAICHLAFRDIYETVENLLEKHLWVPVVDLDAKKQYSSDCFVDVCPNCHAALHRIRPWRVFENLTDILR